MVLAKEYQTTSIEQKIYREFLKKNPNSSRNNRYIFKSSTQCLIKNISNLPSDIGKSYVKVLNETLDLELASKIISKVLRDGRKNTDYEKIKIFHSKVELCFDEITHSLKLSKSNAPETPLEYKWGQSKSYIDFYEREGLEKYSARVTPNFSYFMSEDPLFYDRSSIGNGFNAVKHFSFYKNSLAEVSYQGILRSKKYHPDDYEEVSRSLVKKYGKAHYRDSRSKNFFSHMLPDSYAEKMGLTTKAELFSSDKFTIVHGLRTDIEDFTNRFVNHYVLYLNKKMYSDYVNERKILNNSHEQLLDSL